jgi:hypothetical protein
MAMPGIQKLASQFADKDVIVLGINQDEGNATARVKQLLEAKKITYRQLMDPTKRIGPPYRVSGIPYMVLIDQKGIIRDVRSGYAPGSEEQIAQIINQLLRKK